MNNRKTITGRLDISKNIYKYFNKLTKKISVPKQSICVRKKGNKKLLVNVSQNKVYYGVSKRLGTGGTGDDRESYFGEVYQLYFPPNLKQKDIKLTNTLAGKIIPLSDDDFRKKFDIFLDAWKELIILQKITKDLLKKKISPHFSLYYGYFLCKDGNITDFSNINIINKMKLRNLLAKLKKRYKQMIFELDDFDSANRTAIDMVNSINVKIRALGLELEKYEYNVKYPNPKYGLIVLMELENTTLSNVIFPSDDNLYGQILIQFQLHLAKKFKDKFFIKEIKKIIPSEFLDNPKKCPDLHGSIYTDRLFIYSMVFQVAMGIYSMSRIGIAHLDLHIDNVLISFNEQPRAKVFKTKNIEFWKYKIRGRTYLIPNYGFQCRIADFGLSETMDSFVKKSKPEKRELGMYIVDKLAYFVLTQQDERRVDNAAKNIINNIVNQSSRVIFDYLRLFDIMIFLISLIAEIEFIAKELYLHLQEKVRIKIRRANINIAELLDTHHFMPDHINTLKLILSYMLDIFLSNLGRRTRRGNIRKYNYFDILSDILDPFNEKNINLKKGDSIINNNPYR